MSELNEFLDKATGLYNQGLYSDAIPFYQKALTQDPENFKALKEVGNCYFYSEMHDQAEKYYRRAYEVNPGDKNLLYNLGLIAELHKQYSAAIGYYEAALEIDPHFDLPKANLQMVREIHMWLEGDWQKKSEKRWRPGLDWDEIENRLEEDSARLSKPNLTVRKPEQEPTPPPDKESPDKDDMPTTDMSIEEAMNELNQLIGLGSVKQEVQEIVATLELQSRRGSDKKQAKHFVFTGNPGTGKTTVARILGDIFNAIGYLPSNKLIEMDRSKLVAQYIGQTAPKVSEACDNAMGGVLFIDEAYALIQGDRDEFGKEAISTLLKRMEDDRGKFVVIVAGYKKEMHDFISANPGLKSRFTDYINFPDYDAGELKAIFDLMLNKEDFVKGPGVDSALDQYFYSMTLRKDKNFANARNCRNTLDQTIENLSMRFYRMKQEGTDLDTLDKKEFSTVLVEDLPIKDNIKKLTIDAAMAELNRLVGLEDVKENIKHMIHRLEIQKLRGKEALLGKHFVFRGNPGTGKTTVARLMAKIFHAAGLLPSDYLVEVDRSDLVAGYSGQTAPKVNDVCDRAMGGVLFIDEAYSLLQGPQDAFGEEAINTLLKRMEDDRGKFVVIAAGYTYEMEIFLSSNSGFRSRFSEFIDFPDFSGDQMAEIFKLFAEDEHYILEEGCDKRLKKAFNLIAENKPHNFANAREVRRIFNESLNLQASRIIELKGKGEPEKKLKEEADIIRPEDIYFPEHLKALENEAEKKKDTPQKPEEDKASGESEG